MVITLLPAVPDDLDYVIELKATVLRADLERAVGAWNSERSAQRVREHFSPAWTHIIRADGARVGTVTLRPEADGAQWLEMFYLDPAAQGRGIGSAVLALVLAEHGHRDLHLQVLDGSAARRLYERHGFVLVSADGVDDVLMRPGHRSRAGQAHGEETTPSDAVVLG